MGKFKSKLWFKAIWLVLVGVFLCGILSFTVDLSKGFAKSADGFYDVDSYVEYMLETESLDLFEEFSQDVINLYFANNCDLDLTELQFSEYESDFYYTIYVYPSEGGTYKGQDFERCETISYREYFDKVQYANYVDSIPDIYKDSESYNLDEDSVLLSVDVTVYLKTEITQTGTYNREIEKVTKIYKDFYYAVKWVIILISLAVMSLIAFLYCAGYKKGYQGVYVNRLNRYPVEILIVVCIYFLISLNIEWEYMVSTFRNYGDKAVFLNFKGLILHYILAVTSLLILSYSLSIRFKSKTFKEHSFIYKTIIFYQNTIKSKIINVSLMVKVLILSLFIFLIQIWLIDIGDGIVLLFLFNLLILLPSICLIIIWFKKIMIATKEIAKGDYDYKVKTKNMFFEFKETAETLNNIADGMNNAVLEKTKRERTKTELITNVTHDIKTPLTSIINYVDLISNEPVENEKIEEYTQVLSRQSNKLKRLINDLMDISKISTGNIETSLMPTDIAMLMEQVYGEYVDKFEENKLEMVLNYPNKKMFVLADSNHLHRIFDNLISNILKYSMENTRVYFDAKQEGKFVCVTLRNLSKFRINISNEELKERFVRGDSSRNTEGNGLGLSIVENLMKVQKAEMEIVVDGDLFKVILKFKIENLK